MHGLAHVSQDDIGDGVAIEECSPINPEDEEAPLIGHNNIGNYDTVASISSASNSSGAGGNHSFHRRSRWNEIKAAIVDWVVAGYLFAISDVGIGIFKCSLAYFLASLVTFLPSVVSSWLGKGLSKHIVATVTIYFHPARSIGSMLKAVLCASMALLYATLINVGSVSVSKFFADTIDMRTLGKAIVVVVFCGGGLGFVGWVKQRFGDPLVNVACSLASLTLISVLTKEGEVQQGNVSFATISRVFKMTLLGVFIALAVCLFVFPTSAKTKLRITTIELADSLSEMLGMITGGFLQGDAELLERERFKLSMNKNKKSYTKLDELIKEAKLEHYLLGRERQYRIEKNLVRCIQEIAQNMGGLKSAAALQFVLLEEKQKAAPWGSGAIPRSPLQVQGQHQQQNNAFRPGSYPIPENGMAGTYYTSPGGGMFPYLFTPVGASRLSNALPSASYEMAGAIEPDANLDISPTAPPPLVESPEPIRRPSLSVGTAFPRRPSPAEMFEEFIFHLGPSMQSLAFTVKEILSDITYAPIPEVASNDRFYHSLIQALELYQNSRHEALKLIYTQKGFMRLASDTELEVDLEDVAASCGHFSFSLQEFAEHLKDFLEIMDELQYEIEFRPKGRSWNWMKFWKQPTDVPYSRYTRKCLSLSSLVLLLVYCRLTETTFDSKCTQGVHSKHRQRDQSITWIQHHGRRKAYLPPQTLESATSISQR